MRFLNSWLEVLTTIRLDGHVYEICASAVAHHNRTNHKLVLYRDTFARRAGTYGLDEYSYPEWMPEPGVVHSSCPAEEADRVAHQHFSEWAQHVHSRIPGRGPVRPETSEIGDEVWYCTGSD